MLNLKCINSGGYWLTPGKIYQGYLVERYSDLYPDSKEKKREIMSYKLVNDKGVEFYSELSNFIELQTWREEQIDKILNDDI